MSVSGRTDDVALHRGKPDLRDLTADADPDELRALSRLAFVRQMGEEFTRMRMVHQFGVDEVLTKVSILRQEFLHLHRYNPIEHVDSRVKSVDSMVEKALRRGLELTPAAIRAGLTDIAGVRVTCSFIADTYRILETLTSQSDVDVVWVKDYIETPKPNGYRSLHALVEIPVFLSSGPEPVKVELQVRTIAMDFWASLEHKIYYKYQGEVPDHLAASLTATADVAQQLDRRMESLHHEVRGSEPSEAAATDEVSERLLSRIWEELHHAAPPPR